MLPTRASSSLDHVVDGVGCLRLAMKRVVSSHRCWRCCISPRQSAAIRLKVIGEGPLAWRVADAATADTRIEFLGPRSKHEVLETMREAAFLVFPSTWYEGFPLVIAEAFATGLPVVGSRLGAMAEIIEDGITGRLFSAGDADGLRQAVTWAFSCSGELGEMGLRVLAEYERKYTAEANYARLMTVYETASRMLSSAVMTPKVDEAGGDRMGVWRA